MAEDELVVLQCPRCGLTLTAESEDNLVERTAVHLRQHGNDPKRGQVLKMIRAQNPA